MIPGYLEATATLQLWYRRFLPVRSSPRKKPLYLYSTMKATANALIPVETANASTHLSVDRLRRKPYRSARPARLTTRTCPQSRPRGDYHRSTPMTQEHQPCSASLMQPARPTVHHPPSPQASLCLPHVPSSTS